MRNDLAQGAILAGCSHLLMMDSDQRYPPDCIEKLVDRMDNEDMMVLAAPVHRRYPPFDPILFRGEVNKYKHVPDKESYSGDVIPVDAIGCGCIMYDMKIFEIVERPWYQITVSDEGKTVGEDIYFCSNIRKKDIGIFVDTSIKIQHLTTYEVDRMTYELFKKLKGVPWQESQNQ